MSLHLACSLGQLDVVKTLLVNGANVNLRDARGSTPLLHAASRLHVEVIRELLENGADPTISNIDGDTAFYVTHSMFWDFDLENDRRIVQKLLESAVNPAVDIKEPNCD